MAQTAGERRMIMIMTDNDYDRAIAWCKKKIENVKKYHILSGKRLEGYEEAMLCIMSYLHCEKERLADTDQRRPHPGHERRRAA